MFPVRSAISRLPRVANHYVVPVRNNNVIAAPPRNRISSLEKICHGVFIMSGCCFVPGWVLVHIREYRGRPE